MKKTTIIILILILIGIAGIVGYRILDGSVSFYGRTLTSDDNKYSMQVPTTWSSAERPNVIGILAAENRSNNMYALLSVNPYVTDGTTIEDYINAYIWDIANNSDDPAAQRIITAPAQTTFGDNVGYYFELESSADGLRVILRDFVFVTGDGYVHIDVAAPAEDAADSETMAKGIISSVKYSADGNVSGY